MRGFGSSCKDLAQSGVKDFKSGSMTKGACKIGGAGLGYANMAGSMADFSLNKGYYDNVASSKNAS